jgi:hypothetical protein
MRIAKWEIQSLPTTILIVVGLLVWVFTPNGVIAYYEATYAESAHGDLSYGVNHSGTGYPTGSCAHCHDTFDGSSCGVNELMFFALNKPISQTNNFCFQCHQGVGPVQDGGIPYANDDYGSQFGGGTANSTNIKDAFNFGKPNQTWDTGSSHKIENVRNWVQTTMSWGDWITINTNGCVVCHPPHHAQKNHDPYTTYKTAVRLPSQGGTYPDNLWGDEAGVLPSEMMSEYTAKYRAPYRMGKTTYEPDGSDTTDGSNLPHFVKFCFNCHQKAIPTDANIDGDLHPIVWDTTAVGNKHGQAHDPTNRDQEGGLIAPYTPDHYNYVLACTDCHEPHGSTNPFLLRTCVNGKDNISISIADGADDWSHLAAYEFCTACHYVNQEVGHHAFDDTNKTTWTCTGVCHGHREGGFGF